MLKQLTVFILALMISNAVFAKDFSITVKDNLGREFVFDKQLKRVIGIAWHFSPYLYAMQGPSAADILVNMIPAYQGGRYSSKLYEAMMPEYKNVKMTAKTTKNSKPNIEEILKDKPELVVQWGNDKKNIEPLERVGLKVFAWPCCSLEDNFDTYLYTSYISGNIGRATTMIQNYRDENEALKKMFAKAKKKISVLEVDQITNGIRVVANGYNPYDILGMDNKAADDTGQWWKNIDIEQMLIWSPEVIIIPSYAKNLNPKDFYDKKLFSEVPAVKNKRVYRALNFFNGSPESYLIPTWIATVAHGAEKVKFDKPLKQRIIDAFKYIYGKDLTKEQIDSVLEMEENKLSNKYTSMF